MSSLVTQKENKKITVGTIISTIFTLVVLGFAVYILISAIGSYKRGTLVKVFGYSVSIVGSSSMEPTISVGDIIVIKNEEFSSIEVDDIIVYHNEELKMNIVHRVVQIDEDGSLITRGDNPVTNPTTDKLHTTRENYLGKVTKHGPLFGLGSATLNYRGIVFAVIFLVFVLFVAFQVMNFIKEKQTLELKKQREEYVPDGTKVTDEDRQKLKEELLKELREQLKIENSKEENKQNEEEA